MILDTTFIIDLMRDDSDAVVLAESLEGDFVQQRISAMTVFELYHGIEKSMDSDDERRRVTDVIDTKPIYPADGAVMRKAGRIHGRLENRGEPIGEGDSVVAATAIVTDEPVVTRNVGHFERVEGVEVRSY